MKKYVHIGMLTFVGLTMSNFLFQAFNGSLWLVAAERSFFELIAIVALIIGIKISLKTECHTKKR